MVFSYVFDKRTKMDYISFFKFFITAFLGFAAVVYLYFAYRFFINWRQKFRDKRNREPSSGLLLAIFIIVIIPPVYIIYLLVVHSPMW